MTGAEVQPLLRALRKAGVHVVALHNHMVGEQPPFYFTHFWGKGPADKLAEGLRSALGRITLRLPAREGVSDIWAGAAGWRGEECNRFLISLPSDLEPWQPIRRVRVAFSRRVWGNFSESDACPTRADRDGPS